MTALMFRSPLVGVRTLIENLRRFFMFDARLIHV